MVFIRFKLCILCYHLSNGDIEKLYAAMHAGYQHSTKLIHDSQHFSKARQVYYIAHFIHSGNSQCFTENDVK